LHYRRGWELEDQTQGWGIISNEGHGQRWGLILHILAHGKGVGNYLYSRTRDRNGNYFLLNAGRFIQYYNGMVSLSRKHELLFTITKNSL
jgi:hypothetical protein